MRIIGSSAMSRDVLWDGAPRRAHTDGMALGAHTAADVRNQLIELKDQAVAAAKRGDEPFLRG